MVIIHMRGDQTSTYIVAEILVIGRTMLVVEHEVCAGDELGGDVCCTSCIEPSQSVMRSS